MILNVIEGMWNETETILRSVDCSDIFLDICAHGSFSEVFDLFEWRNYRLLINKFESLSFEPDIEYAVIFILTWLAVKLWDSYFTLFKIPGSS
jgi:hypothetical protein